VLRFVCISDTHNDLPDRSGIPDGDILLHAGDLTDFGDIDKELRPAVDWLCSLPHRLKIVIAGNHDFTLDTAHTAYTPEARRLLTSPTAIRAGIRYLDREVATVAHWRDPAKTEKLRVRPLRIYANPCQPEFLGKPYAFIYPPAPSDGATAAWTSAPTSSFPGQGSDDDEIPIFLTHSPPLGRLDIVPVPGAPVTLTGCSVLLSKIAAARPRLCVFGHYHYSWGVERLRWKDGEVGEVIEKVTTLAVSAERRRAEGGLPEVPDLGVTEFDFTEDGDGQGISELGKEERACQAGLGGREGDGVCECWLDDDGQDDDRGAEPAFCRCFAVGLMISSKG